MSRERSDSGFRPDFVNGPFENRLEFIQPKNKLE